MFKTTLFRLSIFSICAIGISACSSSNDTPAPALSWQACSDNVLLDCAKLKVPRDYQDASAGTIELALRRNPAPAATRKGALLVHLGGQGAAADGVDDLANPEDYATPDAILEAYDLVGFDPRGSGNSTPIDCSEFRNTKGNSYPTTSEEILMLETTASQYASDCFEKYGDFLLNIGSQAAAQDMDEIRKALGEQKLNFFGVSFGARMGSLYLQNYPLNSGNFVLDAPGSSDASLRLAGARQIAQMQMNLETLLGFCTAIDPTCNPEALIATADTRLDTLVAENADRELDLFLGMLVFASNLSDGPFLLDPLVNYLQNRDLAELEDILGQVYDENVEDEINSAIDLAVFCADDAARPDSSSLISDLAEFNQVSNIYSEYVVGTLTSNCTGWPQALNPVLPIATNQAPQALVIGGATDSVTPIQGARETTAAIDGWLIESAHTGHDTVFSKGNNCVDTAVTEFLLTGTLPTITECPPFVQ